MPKGIGKFLPSVLIPHLGAKSSSPPAQEHEGSNHGGATAGSSNSNIGSLNPRQQLEESYCRLFRSDGSTGEAWRKEFFQKVHILVLGRSGVGKTTLIRLMVGKDGPQSVSDGIAGVQNINEEFLYSSEEQGVPLIIHDSNGMDVRGKERVTEIKAFLDKHQNGDDFTERIHIVWYVISAIDPRCVDDGDVMQMISEYKIPLLLIMTHKDHDKKKVTDAVLNLLLQKAYGAVDEDQRKTVKDQMVMVGNDGVSMGENNELIIDESKRDTEGLKLVAKRTQQLMDKKLRYTWIAAQAVDVDGKLDESAGIIAGFARRALFTSLPRAIPLADPLKLTIIFYRLIVIMGRIWVVPPELSKALNETLLQKEASCRVLRRFGEDMVYVASLAITGGATVVTGGAALPSVIVVLAASGVLNVGKKIPVLVKTFALQVLGTILYVKSAQVASSKHRWKPGVSKEEYIKLCEEFADNAEYQTLLVNFAKREHSTLDIAVRKSKVKGLMKSKIVEMYRRLLRNRPTSLFSFLCREAAADTSAAQAQQQVVHNINEDQNRMSTSSEEEEDLNDELDELEQG